MNKRVVITGLGMVSPLGCDPEVFFQRLCEGKSAFGPLNTLDLGGNTQSPESVSYYGYEIKDFNARDILGKKGLRYLNKGTLFLASAAQLAVNSAGLDQEETWAEEAGVIIGTSFGNFSQTTDYTSRIFQEGPGNLTPMESYDVALNSSTNYVSVKFHLKGIARTISSGFTSALDAVTDAYRMIRRGDAELLLTGGMEQISVDHRRILSLEYPFCDRDGQCEPPKPYGKDRNGFLLGEGSVVFVLEEFDHARKRGAGIYTEITGWGSLFAGARLKTGCVDSMKAVLADSSRKPETIDWIVGNGNGSDIMDRMEAEAIADLFGTVNVSSIKRMVGEGYGISGGFSLMAGVKGLINKKIPGTGVDNIASDCPIRLICQTIDSPELSNVLINSLDPQGNFSHLILSPVPS